MTGHPRADALVGVIVAVALIWLLMAIALAVGRPEGELLSVTLRSVDAAGYNRSRWLSQRVRAAVPDGLVYRLERANVAKPFDQGTRVRWSARLTQRRWFGRILLAIMAASLSAATVGCGGSLPELTSSESPDSRVVRSQAVLDQFVGRDDAPGCSAAVADRGVIVWQGSRGLADLDSHTAIGSETSFSIGSVSKQFIAIGVLLLEQAGQLSTSDRLSKHFPGMPGWADRVTLAQMMHHSSGIPEYFGFLGAKGRPEATLTKQEVLAKISAAKKLRFQPGTKWEYSNSNYLLLGVIIERVSGQPLGTFLRERIFDPLQLDMVAGPGQEISGRARAYSQPGSEFEKVEWHLYALGPGGIWSTSSDLVRWADNYRTGNVGGPALLMRVFDGAQDTGFESSRFPGARYGAGIFILPDNRLVHDGDFEGFESSFIVSPDRQYAAAVLCNRYESTPDIVTEVLASVWEFR
jgi:CubicO group peptidase (beta-lactamase class C family)